MDEFSQYSIIAQQEKQLLNLWHNSHFPYGAVDDQVSQDECGGEAYALRHRTLLLVAHLKGEFIYGMLQKIGPETKSVGNFLS